MMDDDGMHRAAWRVLATGTAVLAAIAARKVMRSGWQHATGEDPPLNPVSPETDWRDAILWSVCAGATIGVARLAARRIAASGWHRATGELPPL